MHQSYSKNIFLLQIKIISSALAKIKITSPAHAQTLSRQLTPGSLAYACNPQNVQFRILCEIEHFEG